jgi:HEAT repeat protein
LQKLKEDAAPALPAIKKLLDDVNETLGRDAARTLACIGPAAIPILKKAARNRDEEIRSTAEAALRKLGVPG